MRSVAYIMPILPGRTDEVRLIASECMGKRKAEYAAANREKGIAREYNWLQKSPAGDLWISYIEARDVDDAYRKFIEADSEFDTWYKQQLHYVTGIDFSQPGPMEGNPVMLHEVQGEALPHAVPVAMAMPVLPGKTVSLKAWFEELKGPRREELLDYLERAGLAKEAWYLQPSPDGDMLITFALVEDPEDSFRGYAFSDHPFDTWVKGRIIEFTGVDMNAPEDGLVPRTEIPELILDWHHAYEAAA